MTSPTRESTQLRRRLDFWYFPKDELARLEGFEVFCRDVFNGRGVYGRHYGRWRRRERGEGRGSADWRGRFTESRPLGGEKREWECSERVRVGAASETGQKKGYRRGEEGGAVLPGLNSAPTLERNGSLRSCGSGPVNAETAGGQYMAVAVALIADVD